MKRRIERVESCLTEAVVLKDDSNHYHTITEQMTALQVPGVSITVIHNGRVEWAKGYGVVAIGGNEVTPGTLFQAGSISKPIGAVAVLHLVQEGKLSLDSDVNNTLTTWKVAMNSFAAGAPVTLRELLTHTAGLSVHGFRGYAAGASVPTLLQVLNGEKPANTEPIRIESSPGSTWKYSGGGYTVMQQLLLDVSKQSFADLLHDLVLAPIGMTSSTYQQPLPASLQPAAATPYINGAPVPGGAHTYPEQAAAGLWTTPSDLARYILEVQQSLQGKANHVLNPDFTKQMLTAGKGHWALGLNIGGSAGDPYFSHGGVNEGFESLFVGYESHGEGAAIMTNAQGGYLLAEQILRSVASVYDWPDFRPVVHAAAVKVDRSILARYVGTYELEPDLNLVFTLEGDRLMSQATDRPKFPVFPESETKFFLTVVDAGVEFLPDDKGVTRHLILRQDGRETKAVKK